MSSLSLLANKVAFTQELAALLNRYSVENDSNTPDFILAEYLFDCLSVWQKICYDRECWYGKHMKPGQYP